MKFLNLIYLLISAILSLTNGVDSNYFDVLNTCKIDNWGIPKEKYTPLPKEYYHDTIQSVCNVQWKDTELPMSDALDMATAIHSKNTQLYDDYRSTDWIPENKNKYSSTSPWGKPSKFDFTSFPAKSIMSSHCHIDIQEDNSAWEVTRIGPFTTTGGYDWLQIGWDNIWNLKSILKQHSEIYIIEQFLSPVLADGTMLNNPPIHIHHIHVGPDPYVRQRFDPIQCALYNVSCFNPSRSLEHHGDYNCKETDGGLGCRMESFPDGYVICDNILLIHILISLFLLLSDMAN
jgi:hypothetical protein